MKWSFHRLRIRALQLLTKTVKPSVPLSYIIKSLGFGDAREAARFVINCGGVFECTGGATKGAAEVTTPEEGGGEFYLDCKSSAIEMVREVTEEEVAFKGAAFSDYLKAAVTLAGTNSEE